MPPSKRDCARFITRHEQNVINDKKRSKEAKHADWLITKSNTSRLCIIACRENLCDIIIKALSDDLPKKLWEKQDTVWCPPWCRRWDKKSRWDDARACQRRRRSPSWRAPAPYAATSYPLWGLPAEAWRRSSAAPESPFRSVSRAVLAPHTQVQFFNESQVLHIAQNSNWHW